MSELDDLFDDANGDLAIGDLDSAVEKYRRCVELDPGFFDGWHALGMALMKIGRIKEAIGAGLQATTARSAKPKLPKPTPASSRWVAKSSAISEALRPRSWILDPRSDAAGSLWTIT